MGERLKGEAKFLTDFFDARGANAPALLQRMPLSKHIHKVASNQSLYLQALGAVQINFGDLWGPVEGPNSLTREKVHSFEIWARTNPVIRDHHHGMGLIFGGEWEKNNVPLPHGSDAIFLAEERTIAFTHSASSFVYSGSLFKGTAPFRFNLSEETF